MTLVHAPMHTLNSSNLADLLKAQNVAVRAPFTYVVISGMFDANGDEMRSYPILVDRAEGQYTEFKFNGGTLIVDMGTGAIITKDLRDGGIRTLVFKVEGTPVPIDELQVGDVVYLKSGSPGLTVYNATEGREAHSDHVIPPNHVGVMWADRNWRMRYAVLNTAMLQREQPEY